MDRKQRLKNNHGVTLVEVTLAIAIFAGVIAVTAQSLASFYVSVDIQEQRMEAIAASRSVMDALREKRAEFKGDFPEGLLAWIETTNETSWATYLADNDNHTELSDQSITVSCRNAAGDEAGPGDNPIEVQVITTWKDRRGRTLSAELISMLTSE